MSARKPTELKILEGNAGKRPLNPKMDMNAQLGAPVMPSGLSPVEKNHWKYLCRLLLSAGVLTELEGPLLAITCQT